MLPPFPPGPSGELLFYDYGMMGAIVPATRERLLELFYGIARKDVDAVGTATVYLQYPCSIPAVLSPASLVFYLASGAACKGVGPVGPDLGSWRGAGLRPGLTGLV